MTAFSSVLLFPLRHKLFRQQVLYLEFLPFSSRLCCLIVLLPDGSLSLLTCIYDILCFISTVKFSTSSFYLYVPIYVHEHTQTHTHVLQHEYGDPRTTLQTNLQLLLLFEANGRYCIWIYEGFGDVNSGHHTFVASTYLLNQLPMLLSSSFDSIISLSRYSKVMLYLKVLDLITSSNVSLFT